MHANTLSNALPIVAAAYGRKFGVSVQVGGDQAATDGQVIRLPSIQDDPTSQTLAWGYLAHEAGHIRHTDFTAWQSVTHHPLTKAITNILEDVRIENAMLVSYPGTRHTLDAVLDWMIGAGQIAAPKAQGSPPEVLANALLVLARHRYRKQPALETLAHESERVLRQLFPPSFVHRLLGLMTEIPALKSTADAVALAKRMVELIAEEAEQKPPPDGSENKDQGPTNDAPRSEPEADGTGDAQDQGTESVEPAPQSQGGESAEPSTQNQEQGTEGGRPSRPCSPLARMICHRMSSRRSQRRLAHRHTGPLAPCCQPWSSTKGIVTRGGLPSTGCKVHSAKLTARLQGLVQAHTMTAVRTVRRGRALSPTHLHRAGVGDPRIFRLKDHKVAPNTALHVLVDLSGSMAGGQDGIALEAAMALALALEPIHGVSRAVTAFPGMRGEDHRVTRILSHGDRVAARAGAFVQGARGSTPMTGALWFAAADLLSRREERKVILILTDGDPDDFGSAEGLVSRATASGIEMIGIGIQHDVSRLFPVAIRIESVEDLKAELFRIAERLLLA